MIRSKEGYHPTPATKESEEARLAHAGYAQQGWTGAPHQPLNLRIGSLYRLDLQTEGPRRRFDPTPERLTVVLGKTWWQGREFHRPRRQATGVCEGHEHFTQP
jgi:hypothetical protein